MYGMLVINAGSRGRRGEAAAVTREVVDDDYCFALLLQTLMQSTPRGVKSSSCSTATTCLPTYSLDDVLRFDLASKF
jgi:hypothetical protein